jgi:RNA 2',3'-cyclic 3'-phosphodiesterase
MRIFVAIPFPPPWMQALLGVLTQARNIKGKWEHPDNYHITLRFIGDVDEETYARYVAALRSIQAPAFHTALQSFGRFPPGEKKAPRILWVGITPAPELIELQAAVSSVLDASGLPPDKHETFHPHMTVARFKDSRPSKELDQFLQQKASFQTEPIWINAFVLYQSTLTPQRAIYTELERFPLYEG